MNKSILFAFALASTGALARSGEASAQTLPAPVPSQPRALLGLSIGATSIAGGRYTETASQWGYGSFGGGFTVTLDGGAVVTPWLTLGARLGMLRATSDVLDADASKLSLATYDVGAWARIGATLGQRRVRGYLGIQLEGGAQWASIDLRNASTSRVAPRVAVMGVGQVIVGPMAFGVRVGPRFGVWSGAGGDGVDLDLGGIEASTGVEVRL